MDSMFCISFFDKEYVQFDANDFDILKEEFLQLYEFKDLFNVLDGNTLENFILVIRKQLNFFLAQYVNPGPIMHPRFEDRWTINVDGRDIILDIRKSDHFKIHLLSDILRGSESALKINESIYLMPRKNLLNEYHLPAIYRVKHFINEGKSDLIKLEKYISTEFDEKVSLIFLHKILKELNELEIITMDNKTIIPAKYFDFFY
jgi:hypothetical protein